MKLYMEACSEVRGCLQETESLSKENRCMADFLRWKGLDEEYSEFRAKAVEVVDPDAPFPMLVMQET